MIIITLIEVSLDCPELKCVQLVLEKIDKETWAKMGELKREVFQFVVDEIRKQVEDEHFQDYYTTQVFAQSCEESIDSKAFDAFAYNSVATHHQGYNFAIKKEFIDSHYIFKSATVFKVVEYTNRETFKLRCLLSAGDVNNYGRINFIKVGFCPAHNISLDNFVH